VNGRVYIFLFLAFLKQGSKMKCVYIKVSFLRKAKSGEVFPADQTSFFT
jgi:hypothetical protein